MSSPGEAGTRRLREAVAALALSPETDTALLAAMETLGRVCGDTLAGVVFFGSRRTSAAKANRWSAYDLIAVVPAYRPFYEALCRAGLLGKRPSFLAAISRWLAPTQVSLRFAGAELHAKVSVLEGDTYRRETSRRRHDHFTIGRLFQPARILLARSEGERQLLLDGLVAAHAETWRWVRPWLPERFDAESYGRRALEISMASEIRPEPGGRAAALWSAQSTPQRPVFEALLRDLESRGEVVAVAEAPPAWARARPVGRLERLRWRAYFAVSKVRATARWIKHVLSFEGWLDYILRKATRHTGQTMELSPRERRWPLVFLWGRVFRYLRERNRGQP
ncbi:MAG TPA: hypothetical protein VMX54_14835 [Vicinamibacteria bacterium]|nr:hypothetical protein [Vicinamibacteria bacterium]